MASQGLQHSDYRIRKLIGILGIALPVLLPLGMGEFLASISHYYYSTLASLVFIIILSAFGLFLMSYKGYSKDAATEQISDDFLTNIAGLAALVVVFIPTLCLGSTSATIDQLCTDETYPLFGHNNSTLSTIHLASAGVFILCMGWMSKYKFTRGLKTTHNKIYKYCGNLVFISVAFLIVGILLDKCDVNFGINAYYVYIFETIAIVSFGISWLVKGEAIANLVDLKDQTLS
jgi:hypothetical protein